MCKCPDLAGDNRKTSAPFAGPRRFDSGVKRENVDLKGNAFNQTSDLGNSGELRLIALIVSTILRTASSPVSARLAAFAARSFACWALSAPCLTVSVRQ